MTEATANRVVIVTGGANGIGRAISMAFAAEGAAVAIFDIDRAAIAGTVGQLRARSGEPCQGYELDIADHDAVREAIGQVQGTFGRLDVLVNNAATFEPEIQSTDVDVVSTPMTTWDRTMAVNLRGPMTACKYAIPVMLGSAGRGVIVNISSTSAYNGDVVYVAYSASKAGLHALTRSIATTHGMRGIRCNTVATGLVLTPNAAEAVSAEKLAAYRQNRLVDEVGTPEEVASLVTYLASDAARYVQGQAIVMDGGATAHQPWHVLSHILHPGVAGPASG